MIDTGCQCVLVVEDDRELNTLIGAYAQISGFAYRGAHDGQAALREARDANPAAIILDLMLPDIDGFEVCRRLKADPWTRHIPVLILTALDGVEEQARARACGADDYLTKPFDPDRLLRTLSLHARPFSPQSVPA